MNGETQEPQPAGRMLERAAAAFEVVLCSGFPTQLALVAALSAAGMHSRTATGALSAPFVFALTLLDTVFVVGLVIFFLRMRGETVRGELFASRQPAKDMAIGLGLIPMSWLLIVAVLVALRHLAPALHNVHHNPLADFVKTRAETIIFSFVVLVAGGVREEIQRGFVLRRFEQSLGGGGIGLVAFSVVFALGHVEQGHDVAVATGVLGLFWGAVFLVRRSILGPMIGHAGFNLVEIASFFTATM